MNNIEVKTLDNGLKIYLYEDKRKHSTYVNFVTKFGGIHQDFKMDNKEYHLKNGMAHLLEHYVCEASNQGEFIKLLGKKHMYTNATTSPSKTSFYFLTSTNLEYGLEILLKGINNPIFSKERLEKVKAPIYQELKMHEDNIFHKFNHKVNEAIFHNIKFKDVGGFRKEIKNVTLKELKATYEAFYQPQNQFLFIGGNFDKEKILSLIKNIYKDINKPQHQVELIDLKEPTPVKKKKVTFKSKAIQDYVSVIYKIDFKNWTPREMQKLDFYLHIFFKCIFSITSNLYKELVSEKIIDTGINYSTELINNYSIIEIGNYTNDVNVLVKRIQEEMMKIDDISEEDFNLFKKEAITKVAIRPERIMSVITPLIENVVELNYPYPDTVENMENLNFQEFKAMIKSLDFSNYSVIIMQKSKD